jgi:nitrate reductase beta subunit
MPMVWYVPPLSPVESMVDPAGGELDPERLFAAVEEMRIPVEYLAGFLAAGDPEPVRRSLARLAAMRRFLRAANVEGRVDEAVARDVGMEPAEIEAMFDMVAIGDYDDRYVIPKRHGEEATNPFGGQGVNGLDFAGCSISSGASAADVDEAEAADARAAAGFDLREQLVRRNGGSDE